MAFDSKHISVALNSGLNNRGIHKLNILKQRKIVSRCIHFAYTGSVPVIL